MAEAVALMDGRVILGDPTGTYRGATLDSRQVRGGELFFALAGEHTDGHRFVAPALAAGAAGAVVSAAYLEAHPDAAEAWSGTGSGAVIRVADPFAALHALTRGVRARVPEKLVGITGSAGKTTTKELLAAVLAVRFRVARSPGNLNNLLGFPLALLGIPDDTQWMVAEMGMSEPGELGRISRLARPDVAVFTNVRPAHLEFFGSVEAIAEAKAELLEGLAPDGLVVANADDPLVRRIAERHHGRKVFYGLGRESGIVPEVTALDLRPAEPGAVGSRFTLHIAGESCPVHLPLHGLYNVENFLAAAACGWTLGLTVEEIAGAARDLRSAAGRGEIHRIPVTGGEALVIDDSYNSNPDAARRALESAAALSLPPSAPSGQAGRRWAVLGDMLELGPDAPTFHREVGAAAARLGFSPVVGVGRLAAEVVGGATAEGAETAAFATAPEAAAAIPKQVRPGDLLLIKGSRGVGLDAVVQALLPAEPKGEVH